MKASARAKGTRGESIAAAFLEKSGYGIIARNYRTFFGEVDIVAVREGTVVFVEVKAWNTMPLSEIGRSVDRNKQRRILRSSECFLKEYPDYSGCRMRYDVLFVSGGRVTVLEDAFGED